MKWSKRDLMRLPEAGERIEISTQLSAVEIPEYMEIKAIQDVTGMVQLKYDEYSDLAVAEIEMSGDMVLSCSISFEDVLEPFQLKNKLVFQFTEDDLKQDAVIAEDGVDLMPELLNLIWLEKPALVISPDLKELPKGDGWEVVDETEYNRRKEHKQDPRLLKILEYQVQDE